MTIQVSAKSSEKVNSKKIRRERRGKRERSGSIVSISADILIYLFYKITIYS